MQFAPHAITASGSGECSLQVRLAPPDASRSRVVLPRNPAPETFPPRCHASRDAKARFIATIVCIFICPQAFRILSVRPSLSPALSEIAVFPTLPSATNSLSGHFRYAGSCPLLFGNNFFVQMVVTILNDLAIDQHFDCGFNGIQRNHEPFAGSVSFVFDAKHI